jgi:hypothetical protein
MYKIKKLDLKSLPSTEGYVDLFSSVWWLNIYGDMLNVFGVYSESNELIAYYGFFKRNIGPVNIIKALPFSQTIPFKILKLPDNKCNAASTTKKILSFIAKRLKSVNTIIVLAFNPTYIDLQPFIWEKYKVTVRYTYQIQLGQNINEIMKNMSTSKRRDISKAKRDSLVCKSCLDTELISKLAISTFVDKKKNVDINLLKRIIENTILLNRVICRVCYKDESVIAMSFCVYDEMSAYYLFGWHTDEYNHQGAGALSILGCIEDSIALKLKKFDFEGSMIPQIESYFRGFGGQIVPYYVVSYGPILYELFLKFFKREQF